MINATGWVTFSYTPKAVKNYEQKAIKTINGYSKNGNTFHVQKVSPPFDREGDIALQVKCNFDINIKERYGFREGTDYIPVVGEELQGLLPMAGVPITQITNIHRF
ncbi:hypothetical protein ACOJQI_03090 [Bacillus salacetis]|uniref:hypothetical protein n=1 Tax=Bacillus salacetis TaxID=2315464 RepID=UPI003B9E58CD